MKKQLPIVEIKINKFVNGGQGIGTMPDGRKCFVWGALPGETVNVQITKSKKDWAEGYASDIIKLSPFRIEPKEPDLYLATSPWQILDYKQEAIEKQSILTETFMREDLDLKWFHFYQQKRPYNYRNKMEYNFWYDKDTSKVSLALHKRGTHTKLRIASSVLASEAINNAGVELIEYINTNKIEARLLKSVIIRSSADGKAGISLFVKDKAVAKQFSKLQLSNSIFELVYSDPKSPASVATEILIPANKQLSDTLLGYNFKYTTRSFFQINIPVYEQVLAIINKVLEQSKTKSVLDLYSGVGSIGLTTVSNNKHLTLIETSEESIEQARLNIGIRKNIQAVSATAESALEYIKGDKLIIVDPPRAGLHKKVTARLIEQKPPIIVYLSCNPSTQARDVRLLTDAGYKIEYAQGFNFFPRTPHIESLIILRYK